MTACRAYQIENRWSAHAANDNVALTARTKLKLRLVGRWEFGSQDQISRRLYDGNLKRVKSFISDGQEYQTIYNIFDSSGELVHIYNVTKNEKTEYVTGPTGTIARVTNGQEAGSGATGIEKVTYMHPDHLGSAQAGTDHTGAVKWREQYTPFGEQLQNPAANDFVAGCGPKSANFLFGKQKIREKGPAGLDGFTGHIKDKATGLNPCIFCSKNCTVQARYYDPVIGRFLSVDPMGFLDTGSPGMFNRYAYTENDPVNFYDPSGMVRVGGRLGGEIFFFIGFKGGVQIAYDTETKQIDYEWNIDAGVGIGAGVDNPIIVTEGRGLQEVGSVKRTQISVEASLLGAGVKKNIVRTENGEKITGEPVETSLPKSFKELFDDEGSIKKRLGGAIKITAGAGQTGVIGGEGSEPNLSGLYHGMPNDRTLVETHSLCSSDGLAC